MRQPDPDPAGSAGGGGSAAGSQDCLLGFPVPQRAALQKGCPAAGGVKGLGGPALLYPGAENSGKARANFAENQGKYLLTFPIRYVKIAFGDAAVAQSVVRRIGSAEVTSSILVSSLAVRSGEPFWRGSSLFCLPGNRIWMGRKLSFYEIISRKFVKNI